MTSRESLARLVAAGVNPGDLLTRVGVMTRLSLRRTDPEDPADAVLELRFPETFETFYSRELPSLVAFAGALSGSAHADDIAQEAMLAAYRHWDEVSRLDLPAGWVRRVCANRAVSTLRRRAVEARAMIRLGSRRPEPEPLPAQHEALWAEVRELPRRQAQVIALHYIFDLDVAGIAATLGVRRGDGQGAPFARSSRSGLAHGPEVGEVMSIDELAREAAVEARRQAVQRVNTGSMLEQLHRARRYAQHRLSRVGGWAGGRAAARWRHAGSAGRRRELWCDPGVASDVDLEHGLVAQRQLQRRPGHLSGQRPLSLCARGTVTITLPDNFGDDFSVDQPGMLEMYRNDLETTGVSIMENPTPVRNDCELVARRPPGTPPSRWRAGSRNVRSSRNTHVIRTTSAASPPGG